MTTQNAKILEIWTDGACKGNPGPGGWGAFFKFGTVTGEIYGGNTGVTNNQMELLAVIRALQCIKGHPPILIHLDSNYVRQGITEWIHNWRHNNWALAKRKNIKNLELWKELYELTEQHTIEWRWVKGHAGDPGNEKADALANLGCEVALGLRKEKLTPRD